MHTKFLFFFILIFSFGPLSAQDNIYIIGFVSDTTENLLSNATITDLNSKTAVASNRFGFFNLPIKFEPTTIKVSFIGYQSEVILITEEILKGKHPGDSIPLRIKMAEKIMPIPEVELFADIEKVHGNPKTTIFDFEFIDSKILILQSENRERILKLISEGKTENIELQIPFQSETLYKDCFGNIHLLTADSICQIYFLNDSLYIGKAYEIMEFEGNLKDIVGNLPGYLIKRELGKFNQTVKYIGYNKETKEKTPLISITDFESERFIEFMANNKMIPNSVESKAYIMKYQRANFGELPGQNPSGAVNSRCQLFNSRTSFMKGTFLELLSKPLCIPLFVIRDSIFIFDHTNGICEVFNADLKFVKKFKINYQNNKGWKKNILHDPITNRLNGYFVRDGIVYLSDINLFNGSVNKTKKIINHIYPEKLKIHNGYAYYLYQDKNSNEPLFLYRQKL